MPELTVEVRSTESVDLAGHLSYPDGDGLSYAASSSDAEVATVAISGDSVAVTGVASGSADITVTASDGSLSASQDFTASVFATDRRVLEILYDEVGGDGWWNNTNWKTDKPLDEWYGVSTNADGRVDKLILRANSLTGEIPPELGDLSNLEWLDLGTNFRLHGEIPSELGSLSDLVLLDLSGNSLTGEIPSELGDLSNLRRLDLSSNSLTGEIPPELGDLANLRRLDLSSNSLTGEIPPELGDLANLRFLELHFNSLTGEIPTELGDLSRLVHLYLLGNSLTGEIPPELGSLSNLEELDLYGNSLTGEIPPELGDLSNLELLYLYNNSLTDEIPPELGNLSNLRWLDLSPNSLTGEIPSELGSLSNLEVLDLDNNSLTGEIPLDFLDLSSLAWFYWDDNEGLCAPDTTGFDNWLDELAEWSGPRCDDITPRDVRVLAPRVFAYLRGGLANDLHRLGSRKNGSFILREIGERHALRERHGLSGGENHVQQVFGFLTSHRPLSRIPESSPAECSSGSFRSLGDVPDRPGGGTCRPVPF